MSHNPYLFELEHRIIDLAPYRENRMLPEEPFTVRTAGRILALRSYRAILFFDLYEDGRFIQCCIRQEVSPEVFESFNQTLSRGHLVGVVGSFGHTRTGEVTLFVESFQSINQNEALIGDLHDGFHQGRQFRELDLMLNPASMLRFRQRSELIRNLRNAFEGRGFLEVETPILQSVASGAQATPFRTHMDALNRPAYLRIAPETYLVRLLVGGMSRIFELGHNFRNEGLSPRHNPEFSMLEFYETYQNLEHTMNLTESVIRSCLERQGLDQSAVNFGSHVLDFTIIQRLTVQEALMQYLGWSLEEVGSVDFLEAQRAAHQIVNTMPSVSVSWLQYLLFQERVEALLIQPTFVTSLPIEASPLAYSEDGVSTRRFELFCAGREIANGFEQVLSLSEQTERFEFQARINQRDGAMEADQEYLNALRYGMPTVSGCGIGVDRLIMLLTNTENIRDIILYPM